MALIIKEPVVAFNLTEIKKGDLIWAKHFSWDKGRAGFVTAVTRDQLVAQYYPGIGNVTNHFIIPATEKDEWEIRYSADLTEVKGYPEVSKEADDEL